jgi:ferredoxin hydrogenase gamma subunit
MTVHINGKEYAFESSDTILKLARRNGIYIPTLCELHDTGHAPGTCRVCMVEVQVEGNDAAYVTACDTPLQDGARIFTRTEKVQELRRIQLDLMMGDHNQDCASCSRHGACELIDVADAVGLTRSSFNIKPVHAAPCEAADSAIVYDQSRCIRCMRCVSICRDTQGVDALEISGRGVDSAVLIKNGQTRNESECVSCGQCVMVCPTGALSEKDQTQEVIDYLADPKIVTVFQIAPSIRVGFGEEFGLEPGGNVEGKVVAALRAIGADVILDTNFAADVVIMEEGTEVLGRVTRGEGTTFTSCCPGWVDFAEKNFPDILPMVSSTRSPQQVLGSLAKTYLPNKMDIDPAHIRVVSIMPCTAKKNEAARPELGKNGVPDVDIVLTIREFARLLRREGVDLREQEPSAFDDPLMSEYTGAGVIFGTTGGVMEAAIRTLYFVANGKELDGIEVQAVRGFDNVREATIEVGGKVGTLKVAMAHGLTAARQIAQAVLDGTVSYDFIEVMACPGGCIDGGGHLRSKKRYLKHAQERRNGLFAIDRKTKARQSHNNQQVQNLYKDFLGEPNSHLAHELLHTHYQAHQPENRTCLKKIWADKH